MVADYPARLASQYAIDAYVRERRDYIRALALSCAAVTDDGGDLLAQQMQGIFSTGRHGKPGARRGTRTVLHCLARGGRIKRIKWRRYYGRPLPHARGGPDRVAGTLPVDKQAAALMLLAGQAEPKQAIARLLEGGVRGMSTFMSYPILTSLAEHGEADRALDLLREYYGGCCPSERLLSGRISTLPGCGMELVLTEFPNQANMTYTQTTASIAMSDTGTACAMAGPPLGRFLARAGAGYPCVRAGVPADQHPAAAWQSAMANGV